MTTAHDVRTVVGVAAAIGADIDVSACHYGHTADGRRLGARRYHSFLAGLAATLAAPRIIEIGTHEGASARALATGQQAAGLRPCVLTIDVEDRGVSAALRAEGIDVRIGDARDPDFAEQAATWCAGDRPDLIFVDALKSAAFVQAVMENLDALDARWLLFDDVSANDDIAAGWRSICDQAGRLGVTVAEVSPGIREPPFNMGLCHAPDEGLRLAPVVARSRRVLRERWAAMPAATHLPPSAPGPIDAGDLGLLHTLASQWCGGWVRSSRSGRSRALPRSPSPTACAATPAPCRAAASMPWTPSSTSTRRSMCISTRRSHATRAMPTTSAARSRRTRRT